MTIPVLVEPRPNGFLATTGAPLDLSAEGPSADEAVIALRLLLQKRLAEGLKVVFISTDDPLAKTVSALSSNPLFEEWQEAIRQVRKEREAAEEAEEAARERELAISVNGYAPTTAPEPSAADAKP